MKKLFVSAGLAAVGAAGMQSVLGQGLDAVSPKAWNVGATLRGFYDDNYNISNNKKGSFGAEISPKISYNLPLRQTDLGIRYIYGLYYYQNRQDLGLNAFDQSHHVDVWLDHAINENWKLNFTDTFAYGQDPELLQNLANGGQNFYRVNGDNLANHANITLDTQWTRLFSTSLHYGNDFYDYQNSGAELSTNGVVSAIGLPVNTPGGSGFYSLNGQGYSSGASLAGLLNRVEENIGLDLQWTLSPVTMLFAGYTFSWVNYTGDEPIAVFNYIDAGSNPRSVIYYSDSRNSFTHQVHVGFSHQFTPNINAMVSAGAQYTDNYNDPLSHTTSWAPYADANVSYTYLPGSYVQLGVNQNQNATDIVQPGSGGGITQYQNSTVVYADLNHRITDKLTGTVIGRFAYSTFEGGPSNYGADKDYNLGANLNYQITQNFWAEVGYNYDNLQSDLAGRGYSRNRVYLGLGASY